MLYLPRYGGQSLVEYALLLLLIAVAVVIILALLGPSIANLYSKVNSGVESAIR
jgi:pilus assembly protein Flp/PilA